MGQHICFGAMCDIVANSHINVIKGTFTQKHWLHGHNMSYRTYRLCPFITFLAFKSGLATNNHIGLLIVGHSISNHQEFLKCLWLKPKMLLKLKSYDAFVKKILFWKFQFCSLYGWKIITLQILPKISQNCLLPAASKIFPTLESNNYPTAKSSQTKISTPCSLPPK